MKKILSIVMLTTCILLTGCGEQTKKELDTNLSKSIKINEDGAKLVCTTDYDYTNLNYVLGSKYVVFADSNNKVTKVISKEIIQSYDEDKLKEFEDYLTQNHSAAVQYNGYDYNIEKEKNKVISTVEIDYTEFDIKKFYEDNEEKADTNLTIDSMEKQYVSLGAECKRK